MLLLTIGCLMLQDYESQKGGRLTVPMPLLFIWHRGFLPGPDIWHVGRALLDMAAGTHSFYSTGNVTTANLVAAWTREYGPPPSDFIDLARPALSFCFPKVFDLDPISECLRQFQYLKDDEGNNSSEILLSQGLYVYS
jgi:hypothetical protein